MTGGRVRREDGHVPLVRVDFDGTLVDPDGRIHPADVEILGAGGGVIVVPATGRSLHSVRTTLGAHGPFVDRPVAYPLVLENGGELADRIIGVREQGILTPILEAVEERLG